MARARLEEFTPSDGIAKSWLVNEIERVLSMGVPVAVVVMLPRLSSVGFHSASTDLILCFEGEGVTIYEYTIKGGRNQINQVAHVGARQRRIRRYNYVIELMPFLHVRGSGVPDVCKCSFILPFSDGGFHVLELVVDFNETNRDTEAIQLYSFEGGNDYRFQTEPHHYIADFVPLMDVPNRELWWGSTNTMRDVREMPFIRGYHSDDEEG